MAVMDRERQHMSADADDRSVPERRCIATGETAPAEGMVRFVVGPDQTIVPDVAERLPGRGIWVTANRAALQTAARKNLFSRAAREKVTVPGDLEATVVRLLETRVADVLGLARRAGRAVSGLEKARAAAGKASGGVVVLAADAGQDAHREARRLADGRPVLVALDAARLGQVFGRGRSVHVFVDGARFAADLTREIARLGGFSRGQEMNGKMTERPSIGDGR